MMKIIIFIFAVSLTHLVYSDDACDVTAPERMDCHPTSGPGWTSCIEHGCCWKPLPAKQSGPWCFFSKHDVCRVPDHERSDCHPEAHASWSKCLARGCCWIPHPKKGMPYCYHSKGDTCNIAENKRFDCHPEPNPGQLECRKRGCCWTPVSIPNVPYCHYGNVNFGYDVCGFKTTSTGFVLDLCLRGPGGQYGNDVKNLKADFKLESDTRLHVKIYDANKKRYEVPIPTPEVKGKFGSTYDVTYSRYPFNFQVKRRSSGETIFNTNAGGFIFSDQFIQISSLLPSDYIYGLGEHILPFKLSTQWKKITMFARDAATPEGGVNIYGTHPFYLNMNGGKANGVLLLNSNAMDILLQPTPAITYRTIGGILDFYIFTGETPQAVVNEYTEVIGRPTMPPYWSLGFHLCKYGYHTMENVQKVRERMVANEIPQDTQWSDIDYMSGNKDFTIDNKRFHGLSQFVDKMHEDGMRYIVILDPAISNTKGYKPFEDGVKQNVFIKDEHGDVLIGKVWPGTTAFPDFFHPNATIYWSNQIKDFYEKIKFDGLWIDMNEPSNFVDGSTKGCSRNTLDKPPFTPGVLGGRLASKTICMNAKHHTGTHYDLHNLYGHSEAVVTKKAVDVLLGKRSLVLTRSSFVGTGKYAAHWLGDNHSTWKDLYYSISGILSFNLFGIPMVGADICGFIYDTNEELCSRWMQLGAFYPFSRNHNTLGARDQDPAAFGSQLIKASRQALNVRYTLLPYLYTLLYEAHTTGATVARPLFFEFPSDVSTYSIDTQFLWGSGLLISPVLTKGATNVKAYLPPGATWYDYYTGASEQSEHGATVFLPASFEKVNLHVRGGTIFPTQDPALNTTYSRRNDFGLLVALDVDGSAKGKLYLDDGESFIGPNSYSLMTFACNKGRLTSNVITKSYTPEHHVLGHVMIYGVSTSPKVVLVNGKKTPMKYEPHNKVLLINNLKLSIVEKFIIKW